MQTPESADFSAVDSTTDIESSPPHGAVFSRRHRRMAAANKEFPPPISWLARTESHVPWVMKKYHTSDGRLIIKEERMERQEYFLANRSNGRLVLNLVHVDDDDVVEKSCDDEAAAEEEIRIDAGDEGKTDLKVEEIAVVAECYKYNGVGLKPCGGFVATAAGAAEAMFRPPVHTYMNTI